MAYFYGNFEGPNFINIYTRNQITFAYFCKFDCKAFTYVKTVFILWYFEVYLFYILKKETKRKESSSCYKAYAN